MATLTIYLDDETRDAVVRAAERANSSVSSWARRCLAETSRDGGVWPEGYFETIAGFGGSDLDEPEEAGVPLDAVEMEEDSASKSACGG